MAVHSVLSPRRRAAAPVPDLTVHQERPYQPTFSDTDSRKPHRLQSEILGFAGKLNQEMVTLNLGLGEIGARQIIWQSDKRDRGSGSCPSFGLLRFL